MSLQLVPVNNPTLLRKYIYLPSELYSGYSSFVPPIYKDEFDFHNPDKNSALQQSDTVRFLAMEDNKFVGRIMGIIFHPWNTRMNVRQARFYQFDCIKSQEVAGLLLKGIEKWASERGMKELIGSFGFSDKDPQGIQVLGFEHPAVIASVSHQPYLGELVRKEGYSKYRDCVSYLTVIPAEMPEFYSQVHDRLLKNNHLHILEFRKRSDLRNYIVPIMELMNIAYRDIFGFIPMTSEEIHKMADQYLPLLDPELVKIVVDEQKKPVAFVIAMANISQGIRKAGGKLFPLGFIHILRSMRKSKQMDLLLGAVADSYRGRGLNVMLGIALLETARKKGFRVMDSHLILEDNRLMRAEMEKLGGILHKTFRIFIKSLN